MWFSKHVSAGSERSRSGTDVKNPTNRRGCYHRQTILCQKLNFALPRSASSPPRSARAADNHPGNQPRCRDPNPHKHLHNPSPEAPAERCQALRGSSAWCRERFALRRSSAWCWERLLRFCY